MSSAPSVCERTVKNDLAFGTVKPVEPAPSVLSLQYVPPNRVFVPGLSYTRRALIDVFGHPVYTRHTSAFISVCVTYEHQHQHQHRVGRGRVEWDKVGRVGAENCGVPLIDVCQRPV